MVILFKRLWIEKASDISEEYYASFTLDRSAKKHLGMLSAEGGVEIETVAAENPDAISKIHVDPAEGLSREAAQAWVEGANLNPAAVEGAVDIMIQLYEAYVGGDADLVEINPLILTPDQRVHVLDAKVTLDVNSVFRHPEYVEFDETQPRDEREEAAHLKRSAICRARRKCWSNRQWSWARYEHGRCNQPGRWQTCQLLRHWWRRKC